MFKPEVKGKNNKDSIGNKRIRNQCSRTSVSLKELCNDSKIPIILCTRMQLPAAHNFRRSPLNTSIIIKYYRILEQEKILEISFIWLIDFELDN